MRAWTLYCYLKFKNPVLDACRRATSNYSSSEPGVKLLLPASEGEDARCSAGQHRAGCREPLPSSKEREAFPQHLSMGSFPQQGGGGSWPGCLTEATVTSPVTSSGISSTAATDSPFHSFQEGKADGNMGYLLPEPYNLHDKTIVSI